MHDTRRRTFDIGPCLGTGGFGEVYRAVMRSPGGLESTVAVKVLRSDLSVQSGAVRRLRDEGRMLARLDHPSILGVHDLVVLAGRVALVTEYVEGADLSDCWAAPDPMPVRAVLQAVGDVASALHQAWSTVGPAGPIRLVHRDIKPTNIRIGTHGQVRLLDFGIARAENIEREARTASDLIIGSLPYMAPERFRERTASPASDVFGLGCCLFERLAERQRFYGRARMRDVTALAMDREVYEPFAAERFARMEGPGAVVALVREMLAFEGAERPSAREVAERCEALADEVGGQSLRAWARGRPWPDPSGRDGALQGQALLEEGAETTWIRHGPRPADAPTAPADLVRHATEMHGEATVPRTSRLPLLPTVVLAVAAGLALVGIGAGIAVLIGVILAML